MRHYRTFTAAYILLCAVLWLLSMLLALLLWEKGFSLWLWAMVCVLVLGALALTMRRGAARREAARCEAAREAQVQRVLRKAGDAIHREQSLDRLAQSMCDTLTADGTYAAVALVLLGMDGAARTWAESGFGAPLTVWLAQQTDTALAGYVRDLAAASLSEPSRVTWKSNTGVPDSAVALSFRREDACAGLFLVRGAAPGGNIAAWEADLLREAGRDMLEVLRGTSDARMRRDAEAALSESQRVMATLLSIVPGMIYRCLSDARRTMLYISEGARRLTGYGPEDLTDNAQLSYGDLIVPEDLEPVCVAIERASAQGTPYDLQYRVRSAGGEFRWVWEHGQRVLTAENGVGILEGLILDITESQQSSVEREALLEQVQVQAAQLQETAAQLQQIMVSVPEGVLLLDAEYRVVLANPSAEQALAVLDVVRDDDGRLTRLGNHRMADLLITPRRQGMWHDVTAGKRVFATTARPVERGPVAEGWVLMLNEITREREAALRAQQQERLAAVGQLAAGIAHDFNNVLAVVVLYSQMASQVRNLPSQAREYLKIVGREAGRGGELIQQILDFGRRGLYDPVALDLAPFLEEQVALLSHTLPETMHTDLLYDKVLPHIVRADPSRLREAIVNLALNARDAMDGHGTLTITLSRTTADGRHAGLLSEMRVREWIRIEFIDTGSGIEPEVMSRIFEPFFTTKGMAGNGLGLAQVHGIVGQHDGVIDVTSTPGRGTTFTVYLPALTSRSMPPAVVAIPLTAAAQQPGRGKVLLLLEEHEISRRTLANALEYQGYRVLTVTSGPQALAVLDAQGLPGDIAEGAAVREEAGDARHVALIICGLAVPDTEAQSLLRALREHGGSVPIVALMDRPAQGMLDALQVEGLAGWLAAPPLLDELLAMVARTLTT